MRNGSPRRSIRSKLIGLLLAISVLPVLIFTTASLWETRWSPRQDARRSFEMLTEHFGEKVDETIGGYLNRAAALSNAESVRRLLSAATSNEKHRSDLLAETNALLFRSSRMQVLENVLILDEAGSLRLAGKSEGNVWKPFFEGTLSRPPNSPTIYAVRTTGPSPVMQFIAAAPVKSASRKNLGTVVLLLSGGEMTELTERFTEGESQSGYAMIADENGVVVSAGRNNGNAATLIAPVEESRRKLLLSSARYGPDTGNLLSGETLFPGITLSAESGSSESTTSETTAKNGVRIDVFSRPLVSAPWRVYSVVPASELIRPAYPSVRKLIIIALAVFIVTLIAGVLASRAITKPLDSVRRAAEQMKAGDFHVQVPVSGDDEVATLARSFQEMAERLERTIGDLNKSNQGYRNLAEHLEQRVEQRTNDYRMANQRLIHFAHREQFLNRLASLLRSSLDLSKVLPPAAEELRRALDVTRAIVACDSPAVFVAATVEDQRRDSPTTSEPALREALFSHTSGPVIVHDLFHAHPASMIAPEAAERLLSANVRSLLMIPIVSRGKHLGSINLHQCYRVRSWDAEEISLVESVARQLADAMAYVALFEEVEEQTLTIQSKNEELEQFVYTVSHDLKTPLVSLQGLSQILLEDYGKILDEEGQHYLHRLQMNAAHLEKLIQGLLELSRVSRVSETVEPVDARQVVQDVLDQFCFQVAEKGVRVSVQEDLPAALCERSRLEQVFANLISNALKFLGNDHPQPRIEIGGEYRDGMSEYWVKDNGIGIDPQFHQKIFGMFHRLEELPEAEGTGIGLAIVQRIVEKHGGKIWVESKKGSGASFHFTIASSHLFLSEPLASRQETLERRSDATLRRLREGHAPLVAGRQTQL